MYQKFLMNNVMKQFPVFIISKAISVLLRQKYIKKGYFFLNTCFWGVDQESEIRFWGSASEIRFFPDFLPIFNIKRQWGTRGESGVSGGGEAQY